MRGAGRAAFAAMLLLIAGTLNIIYGIGALDDANIFTDDRRYIFTNLNTLGWVLILLGVLQLAAIGALLSIGGAYPWWSLAIFFLCVYVIHGIFILGEDERVVRT